MAQIHPAWLERQRRAWLRHDWQRWMRPDWQRWMPPDPGPSPHARLWRPYRLEQSAETSGLSASEIAALRQSLSAMRVQLAVIKAELRLKALHPSHYDPNQPRVPEGNPAGGQWTSEGGASAGRAPWTRVAGPLTPGKHHYVPQSLYNKYPLPPETRKVFEDAKTGVLHAGHGWSKDHDIYNQAVQEGLERFLNDNGIQPEKMTPDQARTFLGDVLQSRDPRVRGYNLRLYMREFQYWLRRGPRRSE